jgi:copper(I)-binding protein
MTIKAQIDGMLVIKGFRERATCYHCSILWMLRRASLKKILLCFLMMVSMGAISEPGGDGSLHIKDAYLRTMPPGQSVTAGFMTVMNHGQDNCSITAAASPIAERVEFHEHLYKDGIMQMRPLAAVAVNAGETVKFVSGGLHLMFFGVIQPLRTGQTTTLTLQTDHCGDYGLELSIKSLMKSMMDH